MKKPFILERRPIPGKLSDFFLAITGEDWKRYKKYETAERAIQAHASVSRSCWGDNFEYRLQTPVGIVTLPVVKA